MKSAVFALCLLPVLVASAMAQTNDMPITFEADFVSPDLGAKTVTAVGNVILAQGDTQLRADTVRMEGVEGSSVNTAVASGRVVLDSPSGTITGDAGQWDVAGRLITFTGKVVLTKDRNVLRGNVLTYNIETRTAKFTAPGARVQGLLARPPGAIQ